jgi:hypothetical protein
MITLTMEDVAAYEDNRARTAATQTQMNSNTKAHAKKFQTSSSGSQVPNSKSGGECN